MSSPLSVSSRIASRGRRIAICSTSLRFFSPPEKPTLTLRFSMSSGIASRFACGARQLQELHRVQLRLAARAAHGVQRGAQEIGVAHARQLDRRLEGEEDAGGGALLGLHRQQVGAVERARCRR